MSVRPKHLLRAAFFVCKIITIQQLLPKRNFLIFIYEICIGGGKDPIEKAYFHSFFRLCVAAEQIIL